jgi:formylglycine-generating enzyme required for sulfatase activity
MSVAQRQRVVCPRCASPVAGDFKYCPACAFRLKAGAPDRLELPPRRAGVSAWLLGLAMATVLGGLAAVGVVLFRERVELTAPPSRGPSTKRTAVDLTVATLPASMVTVPEGVADWATVEEGGKLVVRERWVRALKVMAFEVTRRLYAEYLADLGERVREGQGPGDTLLRIWRPTTSANRAYARHYLMEWIDAYLQHAVGTGMTRTAALEPLLAYLPEEKREADLSPREFASEIYFPWPDDLGLLTAAPPSWAYVSPFGLLSWTLPEGTEQLPITGVAWTDANAFALWAREELGGGLNLRLPVEGEWQRVAHGNHPPPPPGDEERVGRDWPWGNEPLLRACNNVQFWPEGSTPRLQAVDWRYLDENADGQPVGDETEDGIYGMAGNAREWTLTDQRPLAYAERWWVHWNEEHEDQPGLAATRGGSYQRGIYECTVTRRIDEPKAARREDVGFRLVADAVL